MEAKPNSKLLLFVFHALMITFSIMVGDFYLRSQYDRVLLWQFWIATGGPPLAYIVIFYTIKAFWGIARKKPGGE